jgi:transcription elongation factor GreA
MPHTRPIPNNQQRLQDKLQQILVQRRMVVQEYAPWHELAGGGDESETLGRLDELGYLEQRITELQRALGDAALVEQGVQRPGAAGHSSRVTVRWADGAEEAYVLVGPLEINPRAGWISYASPVGQALLGSQPGDEIEVVTPDGPGHLVVLSVT